MLAANFERAGDTMNTLVVSDLHLGNGGSYDIFAGETELPRLWAKFKNEKLHVILNGDTFDFLSRWSSPRPARMLRLARSSHTPEPATCFEGSVTSCAAGEK